MAPKDLLEHLEKGDRTSEHLKAKKASMSPQFYGVGILEARMRMTIANQQANQQNQLAQYAQAAQYQGQTIGNAGDTVVYPGLWERRSL